MSLNIEVNRQLAFEISNYWDFDARIKTKDCSTRLSSAKTKTFGLSEFLCTEQNKFSMESFARK